MKRRSIALSFLAAMLAAEVSTSQDTQPTRSGEPRSNVQSMDVNEIQQIELEARRSVGRRLLDM